MADALIRLVAQDLMSSGLVSAGTSAAELEARMGGLSTGVADAGNAAEDSGESMLDYAKTLAGGVLAATVAATAAVIALTSSYAANAIEAQKQATMAGTTVEAFSTIKGAAEDLGISGSTVQASLTIMQRGMQAAGEQGEAFKASLKSLGVETDAYKGSATGTTDILLALQAQFSKMPDGPEKTAAAMKVFGRGGVEMLDFLNQSTEGLNDNMSGFKSLGLAVLDSDVVIARGLRDVKNNFMDMVDATTMAIGRGMGPMFLETMTAIGNSVDQVFHAIVDQFGGVKGATVSLQEAMKALGPAITTGAVETIKALGWIVSIAAEGIALLTAAFGQFCIVMEKITGGTDADVAYFTKLRDSSLEMAAKYQASANTILNMTPKATEAISEQTKAITAGSDAFQQQEVAAKDTSKEIVKLTMADLNGTTEVAKAKKENASADRDQSSARREDSKSESRDAIKAEEEKQKAISEYYAESNRLRQVEAEAISRNTSAVIDGAKGWVEVLDACQQLPGVMQQIAAGTEQAAAAAANLSAQLMASVGAAANIYDGVNAIGSRTGTVAQGGLNGGPPGTYATTTFGKHTAVSGAAEGDSAMFGSKGPLGLMDAAKAYQADIDRAASWDRWDKEQAVVKQWTDGQKKTKDDAQAAAKQAQDSQKKIIDDQIKKQQDSQKKSEQEAVRQSQDAQKQMNEDELSVVKQRQDSQRRAVEDEQALVKQRYDAQKRVNEDELAVIREWHQTQKRINEDELAVIKMRPDTQKIVSDEEMAVIRQRQEAQNRINEDEQAVVKQRQESQKRINEDELVVIKQRYDLQKRANEDELAVIKQRHDTQKIETSVAADAARGGGMSSVSTPGVIIPPMVDGAGAFLEMGGVREIGVSGSGSAGTVGVGLPGHESPGTLEYARAWSEAQDLIRQRIAGFKASGGSYTDWDQDGKLLRYASGTGIGGVPGYGSRDSVPAMLQPGEIVLSKSQSDAVRSGSGGAELAAMVGAAVAKALEGVELKADGRAIGQLMLKRSRNGQAVVYGPAGSTTAR